MKGADHEARSKVEASASWGLVADDHLANAAIAWRDVAERASIFGGRAVDGRDVAAFARPRAAFRSGNMGLSARGLVAADVARGADVGGFVRGNGGVGAGARGQ